MTETIKIPAFMVPLLVSAFIGSISYGAATEKIESSTKDLARLEGIIVKTVAETTDNSKNTALNAQAIKNIAEELSEQKQTLEASDEKLSQIITMMLEQRTK